MSFEPTELEKRVIAAKSIAKLQAGESSPASPCSPPRVLVACEFSGIVRDAFREIGCLVYSCDLLPSERPGLHYQGDVLDFLSGPGSRFTIRAEERGPWDLMIAHPPCTHLAVSGARWFKGKEAEQAEALAFVNRLLDAPINRIALENPISVISTKIRKPDQIIQPWQFGHGETKATCLWLKNLPPLEPSNVVEGREANVHRMPPGPDRWKKRSKTFEGIAAAMADQWGRILLAENASSEVCASNQTPNELNKK